jgi:hypothetical protein
MDPKAQNLSPAGEMAMDLANAHGNGSVKGGGKTGLVPRLIVPRSVLRNRAGEDVDSRR